MLLPFISKLLIKKHLSHVLYLLLAQLLNQLRFPAVDLKQYVLPRSLFTSPHERLDISAEILMQLLFSVLMKGRTVSYSGIISNSSHPHTI